MKILVRGTNWIGDAVMSEPLLAVRGVTSCYGAVMALKGVDLEVLDWGGAGRPLVLLAGLAMVNLAAVNTVVDRARQARLLRRDLRAPGDEELGDVVGGGHGQLTQR